MTGSARRVVTHGAEGGRAAPARQITATRKQVFLRKSVLGVVAAVPGRSSRVTVSA
jgi:hypothetical protein